MGNTVSNNVNQSPSNEFRFLNIDKEPLVDFPSISDYKKIPLVSIDRAVSPLIPFVPNIKQMVQLIKNKCLNPADNLTIDESAAIMLYSLELIPLEKSFYIILNKALRNKNRENLKKWFSYLKLFTTALSKLPSTKGIVYCGGKKNLQDSYQNGQTITWWAFSSCVTSHELLQSNEFLGRQEERTIFYIECSSGKNIQKHSYYSTREEILLPSEIKFKINTTRQSKNVSIIHLKEIVQSSPSIQYSEKSVQPIASISSSNNNNMNITTTNQAAGKILTDSHEGSTQMHTSRRWFNQIPNIFTNRQNTTSSNTEIVVPRESTNYYLALLENRRSCPRCNRIDRVYRRDILFSGVGNSITGRINARHFLLYPRFTSFMFATNIIHYYSFISMYPITGYLTYGVLSSRFLSICNRRLSFLIAIFGVGYMMYKSLCGVAALNEDLEKDQCGPNLTYQIGTRTRFCFFVVCVMHGSMYIFVLINTDFFYCSS